MDSVTQITNWRKNTIKTFRLSVKRIHRSTGLSEYHIQRWSDGYEVPEFVKITIDSFFEELQTEIDKIKAKLNLN